MRKFIVTLAAIVALAQFPDGAQAQQTTPAAWAGWARCQISVQGPGYTDQQTHTWTIMGGAPTVQGAFHIYPGTWSVVGGGSLSRSQGTQTLRAQWATNTPAVSAPIAVFVRASDNRMFIQARHAQLRSAAAIQGFQQVTLNGVPQTPGKIASEAFEWAFPVVAVSPPVPPDRNATASGSSTPPVTGSVGPMQPGGSQATASCTWQFGQGSAAPSPPPALTAQAIPTPGSPAASAPPANNPPSNPAVARLVSVAPASMEQGVSISDVITLTGEGTHWQQGATTVSFGPGTTLQGAVRVNSPTSLSTQLTVSFAAASGPRAVSVTTGNETVTLANALTIAARDQPVITQISPDNALPGAQNLTVTIIGRGTRWEQGRTALILNNAAGLTQAGPVTVTSPTSMTVPLHIASSAAPGPREITVLNAGVVVGSDVITVAGGFTVNPPRSALEGAVIVPLDPAILPPIQLSQITLVTPNGGESWAAGQERNVGWRHSLGEQQRFDVDISIDRGSTWTSQWQAVRPNPLSFLGEGVVGTFVVLPRTFTSTALVRVKAAGQSQPTDTSDAAFNVVQPVIIVNKPAAGERWVIGSPSPGTSPAVELAHNLWPQATFVVDLSRDGGVTWANIGQHNASFPFVWRSVTGPATTQARIRVRPMHGGPGGGANPFTSIAAESPNFTIAAP